MTADARGVYAFDDESGVYYRPDAEAFPYSDGDQENTMLDILRSVRDKSVYSVELSSSLSSWVTTYHFTPLRSNLLRPFSAFLRGRKVLELGCGCGAITRFLGECGAHVTAVEGSRRRAAIARLRCEGLDNVTIYCDNILDIPFERGGFDCVTLIGVLEYAPMYSDAKDPVLDTLAMARSMLAPGGVFFLAIENQLGLKYLSGAPEDHANVPFFGINNAYGEKTFVTFTRKELDERLARAGFGGRSLFVPLPDYKLVNAVLHPAGLDAPLEEFDPTQFIIKNIPASIQNGGVPIFSMERATGVMVRAGLTRDLANSFLFVCAAGAGDENITGDDILATHYGTFTLAPFAKEAVFRRAPDGIRVERRRLGDTPQATDGPYRHSLESEVFHTGESMDAAIIRSVNIPGWTAKNVAAAAKPWIDWLRETSRTDDKGEAVLPPEYLDAGPFNVILSKDGPVFIDREWSTDKEVELAFVVYRNLFSTLQQISTVARPGEGQDTTILPIVLRAMTLNGMKLSRETLESYMDRDLALCLQVFHVRRTPKALGAFHLFVRPI